MKTKSKHSLAATFVVFACLLFGVLTGGTHYVHAGNGTVGDPFELPKDRNQTEEGVGSEVCSWVKLETRVVGGENKPTAAKIRVVQKSHHKDDKIEGREVRSVKITKITYTDGDGNPQTVDVSDDSNGGDTNNDDRVSEISIADIEDAIRDEHGDDAIIDWKKKVQDLLRTQGAYGRCEWNSGCC